MRFYTGKHKHYCGIDLHARSMYLCVLDADGKVLLHRNLPCEPDRFLAAIAPYRDDMVVGVECIFCWYWLADLCAREQIAFVLGHALYMRAIHGAKAKNDRIDSRKIALLLSAGAMPMSYVYPPQMRATRDLLRRRLHFVRHRGQLLAHIQMTHHQYNLPAPGQRLPSLMHSEDLTAHFADPSVRKSLGTDLALISHYDVLVDDLERSALEQAREHDPSAIALLRSIPGIGKVLSLTILYEIHTIDRFERVQDFVSYCRLVRCAKESAGKRTGTSGHKIGNVHLKWAFSEAAVLLLAHGGPDAKRLQQRLQKRHANNAKALSIIAARIGRAVYFMLKRNRPFDRKRFFAA